MERTFVLLKPDCIQRGLAGRVLSRFEEKGLKIIALKMIQIDDELAAQHYAEHLGKPFYAGLIRFVTASPSVAMVVEGKQAIAVTRKLLGKTFGPEAEPGTIRGDFGASKTYNLAHGSDSPDSAAREIALYFSADEILDYRRLIEPWILDMSDPDGPA